MKKTSWIKLALLSMSSIFASRSKAISYGLAHRTTRAKLKGPNATKGKRHASLKSRSNRRK